MTTGPHSGTAVIFNCYGTLLRFKSFGAYLMMGESLLPDLEPGMVSWSALTLPIGPDQAVNLLGGSAALPEMALFRRLLERELASIQAYPDTVSALRAFKERGVRMGVCANAAQPFVAPAVRLLSPFIEAFTWSCEVGELKPEPAMYEDILAKLSVPAEKAVLVSDVQDDLKGARALGLRTIHLNRDGHPADDTAAVASLHSVLAELERTKPAAPVKAWWPSEDELRRFAERKRKSVQRAGAHARR